MSQLIERAVVKPLEWDRIGPPGSDIDAKTSIGTYTINRDQLSAGGSFNLWMAGEVNDGIFASHPTLAKAKAAAQADYEARILSATQPSPSPTAARGYVLVPVEQFRGEVLWALRQGARIGATPDELAKTILDCPAIASRPPIGETVPGAGETQETINQWITETFGEAGSNLSVAARANEEMAELIMGLAVNDDDPGAVEEAADIVIILYRLAHRRGLDLMAEVDRKMKVNRARTWNVANGHGYHVPVPPLASTRGGEAP